MYIQVPPTGPSSGTKFFDNVSTLAHNFLIFLVVILIIAAGFYLYCLWLRQKCFREAAARIGLSGARLYMALKYKSQSFLPLENLRAAGLICKREKSRKDADGNDKISISWEWPQLHGIRNRKEGVGILITPLPGTTRSLVLPDALIDLRLDLENEIIPISGGMIFIIIKPANDFRRIIKTEE